MKRLAILYGNIIHWTFYWIFWILWQVGFKHVRRAFDMSYDAIDKKDTVETFRQRVRREIDEELGEFELGDELHWDGTEIVRKDS